MHEPFDRPSFGVGPDARCVLSIEYVSPILAARLDFEGLLAIVVERIVQYSCDTCGGPDKKMQLVMTGSSTFGYRVTVPAPWGAADSDCTVPSACLISQSGIVRIIAGSPNDGPVNIVVESLDAPGSCDPSDPSAGGAAGQVGTEVE